MKEGGLHCRCSKCFAAPPRRRVKRRPRVLTLLSLPDDVLLYVLECLPAVDILSMREVHPHLRSLVDSHSSVWARASFQDIWPSPENLNLFERAAECGNFEACVKLAIAYLYNEGLSVSDDGRAEVNGLKASHFFSLTERLNAGADPFVWLFIRPPWSSSGSCCKAVVFDSLKEECGTVTSGEGPTGVLKGSIQYCLAKVLSLFEDDDKKKEALEMLKSSASNGCLHSSYLLWKTKPMTDLSDPGRYLQSFRQLRDYAARGCWDAQISLAKACGHKNHVNQEQRAAGELVNQVFQSSLPVNKTSIFTTQKGMNDTMRYILIDWLVEVATMKDFSSLCLHMTVGLVDRYLKLRSVPRAKLQLVGIACMVICTRFISKEILTIREAVWLTDNTYKYEDLVRMMGEIISALEGKIRIPTVVDYKDVLSHLIPLDRSTLHLCSYISELSLLYTELSMYSPAHLAAGALLLARILHKQARPWPAQLALTTGFTLEHLTPCVVLLHKKCFHDDAPKDYRQVSLTAVKQRFQDDLYDQISNEKVMDHTHLCELLGVPCQDSESPASCLNAAAAADFHQFLCSPSGNKTKRRKEESIQEDRGSFVTTPTAELSNQEEDLLGDFLDWSLETSCSGYEGDRESEGEREGEVTAPSGVLDLSLLITEQPQCPDSTSDDDSLVTLHPIPLLFKAENGTHSREGCADKSSGYSSVSSGGSPTSSSPPGLPFTPTPGLNHSKLVAIPFPQPCSPLFKASRRQVKRKNQAQHSEDNLSDEL
ncbi:cyclin-F-like isoform X2 [Xenopus laevis]|uniref:Cyclin-F n=1 Tax=Xenopus laevis TaxID=8355 RepID=A0A8J1LZG8_XENLA|nr:cyclin-F-like isoform X2 [Xenopus laevis]